MNREALLAIAVIVIASVSVAWIASEADAAHVTLEEDTIGVFEEYSKEFTIPTVLTGEEYYIEGADWLQVESIEGGTVVISRYGVPLPDTQYDISFYCYTQADHFTVSWSVYTIPYSESFEFTLGEHVESASLGASPMPVSGDVPGMTVSSVFSGGMYINTISGTPTTEGYYPVHSEEHHVYHTVHIAGSPVDSVSVTGSSSVEIGSTVTLTAVTSPASASDRTVTWSITSGSSNATIQSQSDTSTGGTCVLKGVSAGTVTVRATADDGSGVYGSKTITVSEESVTFTLSFDANGGSGAPSRMTYTGTGSSHAFTIPSTEPTRSGYDFVGWATSSSASSAQYQPGDSVTSYGTRVLYAVWEQQLNTYTATLKFNANGGSGAPSSLTASITAASASGSKQFTIPDTEPSRSKYTFEGWATSASASTAAYHPGSLVTVAYGNTVTLYAVWQEDHVTVSGNPEDYAVVGTTWSYTPVLSHSGVTLSVSGADWIVAGSGKVSGTPTAPGEYTVTVTASGSNVFSGSQTFTVTVVSALSFTSSPSGGAIIYAV